MSIGGAILKRLDLIYKQQLLTLRILAQMAKGYDDLVAAVDHNANATDDLSAEVAEAVEWIKNSGSNDPALAALAARLEEKAAKADKAKADLDYAVKAASAEQHAATM